MFKYLCISISSVTPMGDRNKYKLEMSISKSSVPHTRDVNKHKFFIRISMYTKVLYDNKYMY